MIWNWTFWIGFPGYFKAVLKLLCFFLGLVTVTGIVWFLSGMPCSARVSATLPSKTPFVISRIIFWFFFSYTIYAHYLDQAREKERACFSSSSSSLGLMVGT